MTQAAAQRQLPRATAPSAVQRLKSRRGARLLQRTTQWICPIGDGEQFLESCEGVLASLKERGPLLLQGGEQVSGHLRVNRPLGMSTGRVMARLPTLLARHPALQVEVYSPGRRVDALADDP